MKEINDLVARVYDELLARATTRFVRWVPSGQGCVDVLGWRISMRMTHHGRDSDLVDYVVDLWHESWASANPPPCDVTSAGTASYMELSGIVHGELDKMQRLTGL